MKNKLKKYEKDNHGTHYFTDASMRFKGNDIVQKPILTAGYVKCNLSENGMHYEKEEIRYVKPSSCTINDAEAAAVSMVLDDIEECGYDKAFIHTDSDAVFNETKDLINYQNYEEECNSRGLSVDIKKPKALQAFNFDKAFYKLMRKNTKRYCELLESGSEIHFDCIKSHAKKDRQRKSFKSLEYPDLNDQYMEYLNEGNKYIDERVKACSITENIDFIGDYEIS